MKTKSKESILMNRINPDIRKCFELLDKRDLFKYWFVVLLQCLLSLLDLLAILIVGAIGAIALSGINGTSSNKGPGVLISLIGIESRSFQAQVFTLSLLAITLFLTKTLVSIFFTRKTLHFLANKGSAISEKLIDKYFNLSLTDMKKYKNQEVVFSLSEGVTIITVQVLGNLALIFGDFAILIAITITLFVLNTSLAVTALLLFLVVALILAPYINKKSKEYGRKYAILSVSNNEMLIEGFNLYREITVRGTKQSYIKTLGKNRRNIALLQAETNFLPHVSKYVVESVVILGSFLVCAVQFVVFDASKAIASLSIFLIAGIRIAPSLLRIQNGFAQINNGLGAAGPTFSLMKTILITSPNTIVYSDSILKLEQSAPEVSIESFSVRFLDAEHETLSNVTIHIDPFTVNAFIGPSGSGKTTLVDSIIGLIEGSSGEIKIAGLNPREAIVNFPGLVSYVPQQVNLVSGTIRENLSLGIENVKDADIWEAARKADFISVINKQPFKLDTKIGSGGIDLSGGEKQRLGIARALISKPKLLLLDEATSALDAESEEEIASLIYNLRNEMTVIIIAHRMSTVRNADKVYYLNNGKLICSGTFDEVVKSVPNVNLEIR
jgi:ABC-type multidrug transport system fused ATPase/permease subunit